MKKKYGLESIIGKKSKLRFPRQVFEPKIELLTFTLPANSAIAEPPLSTALTMKKGDPFDFCDQFNEASYEYEEGFPLNVIVYLSTTELLFEIKSPSIYTLFGIAFDLEDVDTEKFRAPRKDVFLSIFNFAEIKLNTDDQLDFWMSDVIAQVKSIYGTFKSFNCRRLKKKKSRFILSSFLNRRFYINKESLPYNYKRNLSEVKHFFVKASRKAKRQHFALLLERINDFYDMYEDWDEAYDYYWDDLKTNYLHDLYEYLIIALEYQNSLTYLHKKQQVSLNYYYLQTLHQIFRKNYTKTATLDYDLYVPFIFLFNQAKPYFLNGSEELERELIDDIFDTE